jgi:hypothetical protein
MEAILVSSACLVAAMPLIEFFWAWSKRGPRFWADCAEHIATQVGSRRLLLPLTCLLALLLLPFTYAADNRTVGLFILCVCLGSLLRWATPPSVLLLGVSGETANELLPVLLALFPAKIVHLLRDRYEDSDRGFDSKLNTILTTSRTAGLLSWQTVVKRYLQMCDRVLVDLRTGSGHLNEELAMIAASPAALQAKALYLVDHDRLMHDPKVYERFAGRLCNSVQEAVRRLRRKR